MLTHMLREEPRWGMGDPLVASPILYKTQRNLALRHGTGRKAKVALVDDGSVQRGEQYKLYKGRDSPKDTPARSVRSAARSSGVSIAFHLRIVSAGRRAMRIP